MSQDTGKGKDEAQGRAGSFPQPGEVYRHYKGGLYSIVVTAIREDTLEPMVVYRSNKKGTAWARTFGNFTELVAGSPRFKREAD